MPVRLGRFVERDNRRLYASYLSTSPDDRCLKSVHSDKHTRASARRDPAVYKSRLPRDPYLLFPYTVPKRTDDCNWWDTTADAYAKRA